MGHMCGDTHQRCSSRFVMLSAIKYFADYYGYSVCMLWVSLVVSQTADLKNCSRPCQESKIVNLSARALTDVAAAVQIGRKVTLGGQSFWVFCLDREDHVPRESFFSWDLVGSWAVAGLVPGRPPQIMAKPSATIHSPNGVRF